MKCLENYISVKYCNLPEPDSGLYVNDLAGISLKSIDATANSEQLTFYEVWKSCEKRALKRLQTAISNELLKRFKLKKVAEYYKGWKHNIDTTTNQTASGTDYRGFFVNLGSDLNKYASPSELLTIGIQELSLYLKSAGNAQIKIWQVDNDIFTLLDTFDILNGSIGWNKVNVNKSFYGIKKIFVGVSGKNSPYLPLSKNSDCTDCACIEGCEANLQGGTVSSDFEIITYENNSFGLTGVININCDYASFICHNKNLFATSLWYLCGYELLTERIHSERINKFTTVDAKLARELRDEYANQFNNELASILSGVTINQDCCLDCHAPITLQTNLP
jgi:hypothetical protein